MSSALPETVSPRRPLLLIVDDEESVRTSMEVVFSERFDLLMAATGTEAIRKLLEAAPNLMVLDLRMPGIDGLQVLERAKTMDPDIEVIVVTAVNEMSTAIAAMRAGAFTYVVKPFDMDDLQTQMYRALTKHRLNLENRRFIETLSQENRRLRVQQNRLTRELEQATHALHETQDELFQASRLATLGETAASLSHEIQNPLTVISSYFQLIRMDPDRPIAPYLGRMEREVERLSRLARGLMRLATPQAQPGHPVDLNRLVEEALTLIQAKANVQKVALVHSLAPRSLVVLADPDRILQFLLNLLLNACQAMPDGGRLTATTARRASSPERPDSPAESPEAPVSTPDAAVVTVSDTGHGIAPEHLPKIFEPFFTTKGAGAGTGLGLAVVARIVKELGGTITVESRVGEGTTFTVTLPSAPPAA